MKLQQLHEDAIDLQEGILQRAVTAAAMVIGAMSPNTAVHKEAPVPTMSQSAAVDQLGKQKGADASLLAPNVVEIISQRYKVEPTMVKEIVSSVKRHEKADFPKAHHLLGLIGVESSFNPQAKSALKKDPAVGLTQIRPGVWGLGADSLSTIDQQIAKSAEILAQYYKRLGNDANAALHAYNVGIGNHRKSLKDPSKANPRYVPKIHAETNRYLKTSDAEAGTTPAR